LSSTDPVAGPSAGAYVDYAREMVTIIEARIGFHANLGITASQQQLDRSALDLLA
jgi:flagellar basal body rod protein FlgC